MAAWAAASVVGGKRVRRVRDERCASSVRAAPALQLRRRAEALLAQLERGGGGGGKEEQDALLAMLLERAIDRRRLRLFGTTRQRYSLARISRPAAWDSGPGPTK